MNIILQKYPFDPKIKILSKRPGPDKPKGKIGKRRRAFEKDPGT